MRISDWSSYVCSSVLKRIRRNKACSASASTPNLLAGIFKPVTNKVCKSWKTSTEDCSDGLGLFDTQTSFHEFGTKEWRVADHHVSIRPIARRSIGIHDRIPTQIGRASCRERVCQYV